ncbi:unnamed protein product [Ectocarpus sp. 4 AP-2014]
MCVIFDPLVDASEQRHLYTARAREQCPRSHPRRQRFRPSLLFSLCPPFSQQHSLSSITATLRGSAAAAAPAAPAPAAVLYCNFDSTQQPRLSVPAPAGRHVPLATSCWRLAGTCRECSLRAAPNVPRRSGRLGTSRAPACHPGLQPPA